MYNAILMLKFNIVSFIDLGGRAYNNLNVIHKLIVFYAIVCNNVDH